MQVTLEINVQGSGAWLQILEKTAFPGTLCGARAGGLLLPRNFSTGSSGLAVKPANGPGLPGRLEDTIL